jgi:hypothetical protein
VVVKIASSVPELRAFGMSVHIYNKELSFYLHLAGDVPIRAPRLYACSRERRRSGGGGAAIEDRRC